MVVGRVAAEVVRVPALVHVRAVRVPAPAAADNHLIEAYRDIT